MILINFYRQNVALADLSAQTVPVAVPRPDLILKNGQI